MPRVLTVQAESWPLHTPFVIARGAKTEARVVTATITDGARVGRGECVPYARYGETVEDVAAALEAQADAVAGGLTRHDLLAAMPAGAARNALDAALWDLACKQSGRRAWELAGVAAPGVRITAETVGIDTPEAMGAAAKAIADRPLLKVKLDAHDVVARVDAVRHGAPRARLIVDANEAWSADLLADLAPHLAELGVEMIEQPLPAGQDDALDIYDSPIPLCADESGHGVDDLSALAGRYDLINIKLDKTGGLTAALALADAAKAAGLGLMVGCMVGTSLAMAPATLLAPRARYVDLDGPVWLAEDRPHPLRFTAGRMSEPDPGLWG
ncbi:MAG: L-Ala-D/L-Glu epimerase [Rhodobacterales bacterium]|nr:L-Ala-D/L-Glu epimerase [Rhodobacterales bacterium]